MKLASLLWHGGATLLAPLLRLQLRRRARQDKEIPERLAERRGFGATRPAGQVFWLHAASVGETLSVLPVLEAMAALAPDLTLLLTTGTVNSARLLELRLPEALRPRVLHRFVPLDVPGWCARFLDGWRPDAAAFVESELWPNLLAAARQRGVPLALVNARLSARSARRWRLAPGLARAVLGGFSRVLAQTEADAQRLRGIGATRVECFGNLKDAASPLPADQAALGLLRRAVGARPVWLAASTHPGEEALVLAAHLAMVPRLPGLLTIIVPRHPERGAALAAEAAAALPLGPTVARRSQGAMPGPQTAIYVADTLGELGLFYRLAPVALIGGSLVPHGGQNPLEPARLGCAILLGPHHWNFAEPAARLLAAGGALLVVDATTLAAAALGVLTSLKHGKIMAGAAVATVVPQAGMVDQVARVLLELLTAPAGLAGGAEQKMVEA